MTTVFSLLAAVITIFTILCLIEVILSWVPGAKFTRGGQIISQITEPYLGLFRKIKWARVGFVDFSPILALAILSLLSSIFGSIAVNGTFSVGAAIGHIIKSIWDLCFSVLGFVFLLIIIRFIVILIKNNETDYYSVWGQLDNFLRPIVQALSKPFYKNTNSYKFSLLTAIIFLIVAGVLGNILVNILTDLCYKIPF